VYTTVVDRSYTPDRVVSKGIERKQLLMTKGCAREKEENEGGLMA